MQARIKKLMNLDPPNSPKPYSMNLFLDPSALFGAPGSSLMPSASLQRPPLVSTAKRLLQSKKSLVLTLPISTKPYPVNKFSHLRPPYAPERPLTRPGPLLAPRGSLQRAPFGEYGQTVAPIKKVTKIDPTPSRPSTIR